MPSDGSSASLHASPMHLLHRASQCTQDAFAKGMTDKDVTPRQIAVLVAVDDAKGANQTTLTERTGIDRSTLSDILQRMQRKGLLTRRRTREDARAYAVNLTDKGQEFLRRAEPLLKRIDLRILSALPENRREPFLARLTLIIERLEKPHQKQQRRQARTTG